MFISATQLTSARAPSDASAVAFQVAIKQQQEFEEALQRAQERRELEQTAERERLAARQDRNQDSDTPNSETDEALADSIHAEIGGGGDESGPARGAKVDVNA